MATNTVRWTVKRTLGTERIERRSRPYRLVQGEIHPMARNGQTVRVRAGTAWLTFEGFDFVLGQGQEMELAPGREPALITCVVSRALVYELVPTA